jgi:exopolyphosphatase/guanosine-5'-triphosphate,3'-diphosphate pyrophosphatase
MRAAVLDVGSNSIKLLVADRRPDGRLVEVRSQTLEVRISAGIGSGKPRLGPEGIQRGVAAIANLASEARGLGAERIEAVATSAVRDAANGGEFRDRVREASGLDLRILTGADEARLIGAGLTTDPALQGLGDFRVFDLGGGSLECLSFRDGAVEDAASLPLGCVRLTEMFVADPSLPFGEASAREIGRHVAAVLGGSGFPLPVPQGTAVIGTGGTLTTVRAMAAAQRHETLERGDPLIGVPLLLEMLARTGPLGLPERKRIPGLPPSRADVLPTALATLLALADLGRFGAFQHSLRNLRWGVAREILG